MTRNRSPLLALGAVLLLGACATPPTGPSVMVLPGAGRSFDEFRTDETECRQYAVAQAGTTAEQASVNSGVRSAAIGAAVGAAAGAVIGGSRSAGAGAGAGLILGSVTGAGAASGAVHTAQQRYDIGYQQCMYAKGHQVPLSGRFETQRHSAPARSAPPPPPPGSPPPPPRY